MFWFGLLVITMIITVVIWVIYITWFTFNKEKDSYLINILVIIFILLMGFFGFMTVWTELNF